MPISKGTVLIIVALIGALGAIAVELIKCGPCPECPSNCSTSIEQMEDVMMWNTWDDDKNSSVTKNSVSAWKNNGIRIDYNLTEDGYVGIYKQIEPKELSYTEGLRLHYMGSGAPNTIELKLIRDDGAPFVYPCNNATNTDGWRRIDACYKKFECWDKNVCNGDIIEPSRIKQLEIAISNKEGDKIGKGFVIVDEIEGITC